MLCHRSCVTCASPFTSANSVPLPAICRAAHSCTAGPQMTWGCGERMLRHLLSKQLRSTFYISGAFVIYLKAGKGQRAPPEHGELWVPWQPGKPRMASPPPSCLPAAGPHLTDAPSPPPWSPAGQHTAHLPTSEYCLPRSLPSAWESGLCSHHLIPYAASWPPLLPQP